MASVATCAKQPVRGTASEAPVGRARRDYLPLNAWRSKLSRCWQPAEVLADVFLVRLGPSLRGDASPRPEVEAMIEDYVVVFILGGPGCGDCLRDLLCVWPGYADLPSMCHATGPGKGHTASASKKLWDGYT